VAHVVALESEAHRGHEGIVHAVAALLG